jgi:formate C-acetyltransferase
MNQRITKIYQRLIDRDYRKLRKDITFDLALKYKEHNVPYPLRVSDRLYKMVENEEAILFDEDNIGFVRTIKSIPSVLTKDEFAELGKNYFLFDGAQVCNISSDYEYTIQVGFDKRLEEIQETMKSITTEAQKYELQAMQQSIEAVYLLARKYQQRAITSNPKLYQALSNVPYKGASSFYEALVFFRILNYTLWLNGNKHNTIGRFDQYMYPYYTHDIKHHIIDNQEVLDNIEELFISLNFDADLYPGIQQGDNGQSIVLGGCDTNGNDSFNELTKLCLEASLELKLIDPKINLRVNKNTDDKWYQLGTKLTKQGLGFPQYCNDDIVIPSLVKLGYSLHDARDYVVAACWEFIVPKYAMDIPNIDALNFPLMVNNAIYQKLNSSISYEAFEKCVFHEIEIEVKRMVDQCKNNYILPSPFQSLLMKGCLEKGKDISEGGKYNNFGFHGVGLSNASDAISAVKKCVYEDKTIPATELIEALKHNFVGYEEQRKLLLSAPKMGNNDDFVDNIAVKLLDTFTNECGKYKNAKGGIFRAGTGTAMYYIWYSENLGATADGRKEKEPLSANYSPSLGHNFRGVLSVIQSFTKPDLTKTCNGGPLTLEFHDTLFRNQEGSDKVASLVKTFILLGGHQLQLNAVNKDVLLDAQIHPENHKNLIVRVWGWSGYFNELDLTYQNHVIKRLEFMN